MIIKRGHLDNVLAEYAETKMLQHLAAESPLVPPSGPLDSPLMVIGEAPGADEVRMLHPFVGRSGQHLQWQLAHEASLKWELLYVTNVVLFRPPGNRQPYPFEVKASLGRLMEELAIVQPVVVVALGATAWSALEDMTDAAGLEYAQARGKWHTLHYSSLRSADLLVTWHPSAALRDARADSEFTEHLKMINDRDRGEAPARG